MNCWSYLKYEPGPTGILPDKTPVTAELNGTLPIQHLSHEGKKAYPDRKNTICDCYRTNQLAYTDQVTEFAPYVRIYF